MMKYFLLNKPLIIFILMLAITACSSGNGKNNKQSSRKTTDTTNFRPDTINVKVTEVQPKDFTQTLRATGTLHARQQATVRAKVAGEVQHVYVDISDRVKKGELLVKIRPIDFKLKLQQAKAQLARAKATLANSKKEMKRMKGLYKAGSATEQNKDKAITAYRQAKADYQQKLAAKNMAQQQLDYTSIRAPFAGVITKRNFKEGDYVSAEQPVVEVTNLSVMEANMDIPERYVGSIKKGLLVTLHFQSQIQAVKGKVTAVNPKIDTDSRTFLVKVTVQNADKKLSDGLFFRANFKLPKIKHQPAVPAEAVQKSQGQDILWIIKHGRAHRRVVQTGPQNGNWMMIRRGAQLGETVAVGGVGSLIDNYPVTTSPIDSLPRTVSLDER